MLTVSLCLLFISAVFSAPLKDQVGCGVSKVDLNGDAKPYVVGGTDVTPGQYPWMISLYYMGTYHKCGATIINDRWILSAAHCFMISKHPRLFIGRAGRTHISDYEDHAVDYQFEKIIVHENWQPRLARNDITLLKTIKPIDFNNPYINRVCLPPSNPYDVLGKNVRITGWGDLKDVSSKMMPDVMQQADMKVEPGLWCSEVYYPQYQDDTQICAKGNGTAACSGDSGGPIYVQNAESAFVQVGIASYVHSAGCVSKFPNVFTRVSAYIDWIEKTIADN